MSVLVRRVEWRLLVLLSITAALAGCGQSFRVRDYATPEALFRAALLEYEQGNWGNAQIGFEQLSIDLSARDPLLAPAYYYLGLSHESDKQYLLAAQAFERVVDGFPEDTLAAAAMLGAGRSYQHLWRRPTLDPEYGERAQSILRALLSSYPEAKEAPEAAKRITDLDEWFARKTFLIGMHYVRVRGAYDSGIIYFKDVVNTWPYTEVAKESWLKLHELYTAKRWKADADDTCQAMWKAYPGDPLVLKACGPATTDSLRATESVVPPDSIPVVDALARPGPY